jgi:hypothetical protein
VVDILDNFQCSQIEYLHNLSIFLVVDILDNFQCSQIEYLRNLSIILLLPLCILDNFQYSQTRSPIKDSILTIQAKDSILINQAKVSILTIQAKVSIQQLQIIVCLLLPQAQNNFLLENNFSIKRGPSGPFFLCVIKLE